MKVDKGFYISACNAFLSFLNGDRNMPLYNYMFDDRLNSMAAWDHAITNDTSYYPYSSEISLFDKVAEDVADVIGSTDTVIELGVGSKHAIEGKTLPFLRAINPKQAIMNDFSYDGATTAKSLIESAMPNIKVSASTANFSNDNVGCGINNPTVMLLGCTINNVSFYNGKTPFKAVAQSLKNISASMGRDSHLIITQDTNQDTETIKDAYRGQGFVDFRRGFLENIKKAFDAKEFDIGALLHNPIWEPENHLLTDGFINTKDQIFKVLDKEVFLPKNRTLGLVNSYRYPVDDFKHMARIAGLKTVKTWMCKNNRVALHVLRTID